MSSWTSRVSTIAGPGVNPVHCGGRQIIGGKADEEHVGYGVVAQLLVRDKGAGEVQLVGVGCRGKGRPVEKVFGIGDVGFLRSWVARSPESKAVTQSGSASM